MSARCDHTKYNLCSQLYVNPINMVNDCDDVAADLEARRRCKTNYPAVSTDADCCVQENVFCCGPFLKAVIVGNPTDAIDEDDDNVNETDTNGDD